MMLSKINCFMAFSYLIVTNNDTLNQSKKIFLTYLYFRQFYIKRKIELHGYAVDRGSGSG